MNPKLSLLIVLALCVIGGCTTRPKSDWKPAAGPLLTSFAKDVSAEQALPEYPRPQMVRQEWSNLNGMWDYAVTPRNDPAPQVWQGRILVPFPIESALSGVMKRVDEKSVLWYHRSFKVPGDWSTQRLLLHFGAVDWEATIFVNGKEIGAHRGGYDGFSFDITSALRSDLKMQELVVKVWDPTQGGQPRGKQARKPGGIFYTPSTGIWQTAWIEPVPLAAITSLKLVPDVDANALRLTVTGEGPGIAVHGLQVIAYDDGHEVAKIAGKVGSEIIVPIKAPKLWSPDKPFLYDLKVVLKAGDHIADSVTSYFGMRKIALAKDAQGINRLMLNGQFVFQAGPLDQGFWPDGIYTAPTDNALRYDIEITRKLGFNMTRKHVKVEPDRWYYWCDKLGLLVWQDMPGSGNVTPQDKQQFERELARMVEGRGNHPSIIMWVVFNEGWGQYDTQRLTQWVKQQDPSRLVNNASGWTDMKVGDVIDKHQYPAPGSPKPEATRAAVLGEFGGLGLAVDGHRWEQKTWGYKQMPDAAQLTDRYVKLWSSVWRLKDDPGLCAAVYTQITDVETECNGLLTYDRAVIKLDQEKALAANTGNIPPTPPAIVVAPTARDGVAITWRYTTDDPGADWFKPEFDRSKWKEGSAGFGTPGTPGTIIGTQWDTKDIWIAREFELPTANLNDPRLMVHHDEDVEVYINGVLAGKASGYIAEYEELEMTPAGKAALQAGKNTIAVHCHQTRGGQYIDVGLVASK